MKKVIIVIFTALFALAANAQTAARNVYNEDINPIEQIDQAVAKAKSEGKFVICQVGGNWCPWCLRFADFITNDTTISNVIDESFVYIHVNYNPRRSTSGRSYPTGLEKSGGAEKEALARAMLQRLNNPARFGFPVFVVLDEEGNVIHIQDSSFLEEGQGYNQQKVLRFFKNWTPKAVKQCLVSS
jgi:thioredoxin-related protein